MTVDDLHDLWQRNWTKENVKAEKELQQKSVTVYEVILAE